MQSSVNVISLRVIESDVGYPINVFGTVIVRDEVDYKCVHVFRRDRDDAQPIESPVCFSNLLFCFLYVLARLILPYIVIKTKLCAFQNKNKNKNKN